MSRFRRFTCTVAACLAGGLAYCAVAELQEAPRASRPAQDQRQRNLESFDLVWRTIRDRHYDPELGGVDWEAAREKYRPMVEASPSVAEARGHMQAMIDLLGQSHMVIIPGSAMQALAGDGREPESADVQATTAPGAPATRRSSAPRSADSADEGEEGEAGFSVRLADIVKGLVLVTEVRAGSAAAEAGLKPGWQLISLDGAEIAPMVKQISDAISQRGHGKPEMYVSFSLEHRLRGPIGKKLPAEFLDGEGKKRALQVTFEAGPGEVTTLGILPPMRVAFESRRIERDGLTLGYIRFTAFLDPPRLSPQFEAAMSDFADPARPVDGVVLDLRGNVGGIVMMVPGIAGYFIDERGLTMGTLKTRDSTLKLAVFPRPVQYAGPLAVLTDSCSVSAAELLSGGLQGLGRARVFGTATAGEALPAQFLGLPNGDTFLFVFANYTTANGRRLEGDGVIPDEPVPYDQATLLAGEDPMLQAAAGWIATQKQSAQDMKP